MEDKQKKILVSFVVLLAAGLLVFFTSKTLSYLGNDVKVEENSELIYYIDVTYDGIDENSVSSSEEETNLPIYSDVIDVYDKIPEGLTFTRFVGTPGHEIVATSRYSDHHCNGDVIDGYEGLEYDASTRTIHFQVENLQAGCVITVGVATNTQTLSSTTRADYYNTAYAKENNTTVSSGTVHAYVGDESASLKTVSYEYTGTVPANASPLPTSKSYAAGNSIGVELDAIAPGYTFSGWSTTDTTVTNGVYTMPSKNVTFRGSFTENSEYSVDYAVLLADGVTTTLDFSEFSPEGGIYKAGETVYINYPPDSLMSKGIGLYEAYYTRNCSDPGCDEKTFLGNEIDRLNSIAMPESDITVTIVLQAREWNLCYNLSGESLPSDKYPEDFPDDCIKHYVGEEISLYEMPDITGYKFSGWDHEDSFIMPNEDVNVNGSFILYNGSFRPVLNKTITNPKSSYTEGELVNFDITVTNNENYTITDVMLKETSPCYFLAGNGYVLKTNTLVFIEQMLANTSVTLKAQCVAPNDAVATYINTVNVVGGLNNNNYYIDLETPISATASYNVGNVKINVNNTNPTGIDLSDETEFELCEDQDCNTSLGTGFLYEGLGPGNYYLRQKRAANGYQILKDTLVVNISSTGLVTIPTYTISGGNGEYTVTIINPPINLLPNSGGPGNLIHVIVGLLIVIGGSLYYYTNKRKEYVR